MTDQTLQVASFSFLFFATDILMTQNYVAAIKKGLVLWRAGGITWAATISNNNHYWQTTDGNVQPELDHETDTRQVYESLIQTQAAY